MTGTGSAEMTLIAESVANANARVRFYRVAYGSASADQTMGRNEIVSILSDITRGTRLAIDWKPTGDINRRDAKLALLMIQCFENAMPYGGEIAISFTDDVWCMHGTASKLKINQELWDMLESPGSDSDITPGQVQFALAPDMLAQTGRSLSMQFRDQDLMAKY